MPIKDIFQVHRNENISDFVKGFKGKHDKQIVRLTIQFIKAEFPECRDILNGKLIFEEKS